VPACECPQPALQAAWNIVGTGVKKREAMYGMDFFKPFRNQIIPILKKKREKE
jgi:hypothetical protein